MLKRIFFLLIISVTLGACDTSVSDSTTAPPNSTLTQAEAIQLAERLGYRADAVNIEPTLKSRGGILFLKPKIQTSTSRRIIQSRWPSLVGSDGSPKTLFSNVPPDQDICWGQEAYDPNYIDVCACVRNPYDCGPDVVDTLPCGPDDQCGSDEPIGGDDDPTDDPESPDEPFNVQFENTFDVDPYDEYITVVEPRVKTSAVGSILDEPGVTTDVFLNVKVEEFVPLPNGDMHYNVVYNYGRWYSDDRDVTYIDRYIKNTSFPIRLFYVGRHAARYDAPSWLGGDQQTIEVTTRSGADI